MFNFSIKIILVLFTNTSIFLDTRSCVGTTVLMHHLVSNENIEKKLEGNYTRMLRAVPGSITPKNSSCTAIYIQSVELDI